jgi:hypothetical protein
MATRNFARLGGGSYFAHPHHDKGGECSICTMGKLPGDNIFKLGCHETHWLHENCFNDFKSHFAQSGTVLLCPLCRFPVDESKIAKQSVGKDQPPAEKVEDVFNLEGPKAGGDFDNVANV